MSDKTMGKTYTVEEIMEKLGVKAEVDEHGTVVFDLSQGIPEAEDEGKEEGE